MPSHLVETQLWAQVMAAEPPAGARSSQQLDMFDPICL